MPDFLVPHHLLEYALTHVHWLGDTIQPSHPLCPLLPMPSVFPSIRVFSSESVLCIRWPNYRNFSFSIFSMNIKDWFPLGLTGLISLQSKGLSKSFLQHHSKASVLQHSAFFMVQCSHPYMTTGNLIALNIQTFVGKVMSQLFNMLSMSAIAFIPRTQHLLISWLQSLSAVILEPKKINYSLFLSCPMYLWWSDGTGYHNFGFIMLSFKPAFSLSSLNFIKGYFSSSLLSAIRVVSSAYLKFSYWYFSWQSWFQLVFHPAQHFAWCTLHII